MRLFLRVLAVLVAVITVLLLLVGQLLLTARVTLLSPSFLEQVLVRQGVYDQLPELLVDVVLEQMAQLPVGEEGGGPGEPAGVAVAVELKAKFGHQALVEFFTTLTSPAWAQRQVERNVEAVFAWLRGEEEYPNVWLDLGEVSERLVGEEGREAVHQLLARLPPCEQGEEALSGEEFLPHCRPPDQELDEVMGQVLPLVEQRLPDAPPFRPLRAEDIGADTRAELDEVAQAYHTLVLVTLGVWGACVVLLGLIILLAARSLDQVLRWDGWTVLVGGGLGLLVMGNLFVVGPALIGYWLLQQPGISASPAVTNFLRSFLQGMVRGVAGGGLAIAAGLVFVGLVGVIGGALVRRSSGKR